MDNINDTQRISDNMEEAQSRRARIRAWVEARRGAYLEDLKALCRIRSVAGEPGPGAPCGPGPAAALRKAMELCAGYGLAVENHGDLVMTADLGRPEGRALDILAHLDVVDEGTGWDTDPYEPVLGEDGYLYGRGVADDKGGAVAALYALRCVQELGLPLRRGVRLVLGTDEERGSADIARYYSENRPAPNTFTPDAEFPVYNGEKGMLRLRFRKRWAGQEALPRVISLTGGTQINAIPSEASAVVAGMEPMHLYAGAAPLCAELGASCRVEETPEGARLIVVGRGCHAASPELGLNPVTALVRVLTELPLADTPSARALRELDSLLPHGDTAGRALGIAREEPVLGALTCALTLLEFTDTGLEGAFDARVPLNADEHTCRGPAVERFTALGYEASGAFTPPHYTPGEGGFVRTLLASYEAFTGRPGQCLSMGGGTYVHDVPGGVAFGCIMPGTDTRMHGANERIPLEDLLTAVMIYADTVAAICG